MKKNDLYFMELQRANTKVGQAWPAALSVWGIVIGLHVVAGLLARGVDAMGWWMLLFGFLAGMLVLPGRNFLRSFETYYRYYKLDFVVCVRRAFRDATGY